MTVDDWNGSLATVAARLRHATGLTQEQLAERSGLSVRAISSIECGSRHPRRFTLDRLSAGLGLNADERLSLIDLADRTRTGSPPAAGGGVGLATGRREAPLIGRGAELAATRTLLWGREPGLLVLCGPPGIGKSRLLTESVRIASAAGMPVLTGRCRRGADPYAPIADALAEHVGHPTDWPDPRDFPGLELVLPELGGSRALRGGQERRLAFQAVTRFLTAMAGDDRVLLALDDLQWAGPDTADLIAHLAHCAATQVRLIITYRSGELAATGRLADCLADLARLDEVRSHTVEPLSRAESDLLVSAVAGRSTLDPLRRNRILRRAGGLPLFLVELTRAALDRPDDDVPAHLRMAVAQEVAALPPRTQNLLRRMAALGTVVTTERLAECGVPVDEIVDALETTRRHGLVDETRHGYRFRYPLIQELLVFGLGRHERRLWGNEAS